MKLSVEYRCGHTVPEVRFGGKYDEQLAYARERLDCPDCYRAQKVAERDAASATRQAALTDLDMVALQGSEKQVQWANDLRAKVLTEVREVMPRAPEAQRPIIAQALAQLGQIPEAKWWIDRREIYALKLVADYAKAEGLF